MTDIPIIFSAPMVRALLDGRKTMTRRLAWRLGDFHRDIPAEKPSPWQKVKPGDRLWVRESAWFDGQTLGDIGARRCFFEGGHVRFSDGRAGQAPGLPESHTAEMFRLNGSLKLTPSIHMPRWASRLSLVVTAAKVERLQDISEEDAIAEGIERAPFGSAFWHIYDRPIEAEGLQQATGQPRESFESLWRSLHGPESWDANPEVVALSFTVHKTNIDAMQEAA